MDVSIIIVNYNTKQLLADCLRSIYEQTKGVQFEVIVSDNGSADGSVEMLKKNFPQALLIENGANLGFGAANNLGLALAKGKYVFYLNSDTVLLNNAIKYFYDYFEGHGQKEDIGALGCNLLNSEGDIGYSWFDFPDIDRTIVDLAKCNYGLWKLFFKKLFGKIESQNAANPCVRGKKIGKVQCIIGADLFLKNDGNARFDETYFMYCEETDLQYRLAQNGKSRILIDGPKITHFEGRSCAVRDEPLVGMLTSFFSRCKSLSTIYFYKKNISKPKSFAVKILTALLWLNPLVIKYNYRCVPLLFKSRITQRDAEILKK